jgi:hypothetical protein
MCLALENKLTEPFERDKVINPDSTLADNATGDIEPKQLNINVQPATHTTHRSSQVEKNSLSVTR